MLFTVTGAKIVLLMSILGGSVEEGANLELIFLI